MNYNLKIIKKYFKKRKKDKKLNKEMQMIFQIKNSKNNYLNFFLYNPYIICSEKNILNILSETSPIWYINLLNLLL